MPSAWPKGVTECADPDCDATPATAPYKARGLCARSYSRLHRAGRLHEFKPFKPGRKTGHQGEAAAAKAQLTARRKRALGPVMSLVRTLGLQTAALALEVPESLLDEAVRQARPLGICDHPDLLQRAQALVDRYAAEERALKDALDADDAEVAREPLPDVVVPRRSVWSGYDRATYPTPLDWGDALDTQEALGMWTARGRRRKEVQRASK